MLLHHDLSWWSFVLAALALVLMFPASIVANLVTPRLKNWWAERSESSIRRRIEKLESELAKQEKAYPALTEAEDLLLMGIEACGLIGAVGVQMLAVLIMVSGVVIVQLPKPLTIGIRELGMPLTVLAVVSLLMSTLLVFLIFSKLTRFRTDRSPRQRTAMRKSIAELKQKLGDHHS